jgi:hypothetical protein
MIRDDHLCGIVPGRARDATSGMHIRRPQVANDLGPKHAGDVGCGGDAASRRELAVHFLGHGATADEAAPFEHQRPQTRPRRIRRGRQSVVTRADYDDVVSQVTPDCPE